MDVELNPLYMLKSPPEYSFFLNAYLEGMHLLKYMHLILSTFILNNKYYLLLFVASKLNLNDYRYLME